MKDMLERIKKIGDNSIQPFTVSNALIGIQMDGVDQTVLEYFDFFTSVVPVEHACFLHVVNKPDIFNVYEMNDSPFPDLELDQDLLIKLGQRVQQVLKTNEKLKVSFDIREGNPLEELLDKADKVKADLVVIGQNTKSNYHGILSKNLARQIWSNALMVPSVAKKAVENILVPVDFSIHSAEALRIAVAIRKRKTTDMKITIAHVYEMPANYSAYRFNELKVKQMIEEDRMQALEQFIAEHLPVTDRQGIETALVNRVHNSIGQTLANFAEDYHHDLIIMGAKGHSKLALLLMGSVTEKVLSNSCGIPVLVVK